MKQYLNGEWLMKKTSEADYIKGRVPGSIMNDLMDNGLAVDPFYRDNEYKAYDLFRFDYEYLREFTLEQAIINSDSVKLVFEGIDTLADIYLNSCKIASTDNMHRIYSFNIKDYAVAGVNTIKVVIKSPVQFIEKAWADKGPIWGVCAKDGYQFIRKAHYMFGWDWGPSLPDGGIWRDIYIETFNHASIDNVYITQKHSENRVDLCISSSVNKYSECGIVMGVELYNPYGRISALADFDEFGDAHISVENPMLWWPAGYGDQPLYEVKIILFADGVTADTRTYRIGLRTLGISRRNDEWGQSFAYSVNGIDIFAKGANYIPEDNILARCSRERTEKLIQHAVDANFNSLRVWGGGFYPEDYFFDLCDEYGLIVWQDFMFACAQYVIDNEVFVNTITEELKDNIRRLRHHASIALWCGNNEMEWLWVDSQTEGRSKKQMDEYLELFEKLIPPIVKAEDPERLYWPASPSSGGGFDSPNDENRGDVHYWDVWHGLKPFTEYRKFYFRFCSEFGFQSFPCLKTVESFTLPKDRNIFSYVMESHQKNNGANGKILYYLSENFKNPKDFDSLLYVSQLLQAEAIKYGVEHWRRNRGRCMGSIYWQFNDCWPVASWSSVDSFHRWKALHYFAKRFYNPVLLSAEEDGLKATLHLGNESLNSISGDVSWKLITTDGEIIDEGIMELSVDALSSKEIVKLDFNEKLNDITTRRRSYLQYEFIGDKGETCSSTLLFVPNKHFLYEKPEIKAACIEKQDVFEITVTTDSYAGYVELMPLDIDCVFNDNYFNISPGSNVQIEVDLQKNHISMSSEDFIKQLQIRSIADTY